MLRIVLIGLGLCVASSAWADTWTHYGGDPGGNRYSELEQINRETVRDLEVAWEYTTGDLEDRADVIGRSAFEGTPIIFAGNLVFCTHPSMKSSRLTPERVSSAGATMPTCQQISGRQTSSYVEALHLGPMFCSKKARPCKRRLFMGTVDYRVVSVDAETGEPCEEFGEGGRSANRPRHGSHLAWRISHHLTTCNRWRCSDRWICHRR